MIHSFNCLYQAPHCDQEIDLSNSSPEGQTREKIKKEFNCLYQCPSSINSKDTPHIMNMQEMCNNSIIRNFLDSALPN